MELIPGKEYIYTDVVFNEHAVKFIQKSQESYTLQVEMENGRKIWVIERQLSVKRSL
jgi:uncharacterized protein YgiM (DUF1202 family)